MPLILSSMISFLSIMMNQYLSICQEGEPDKASLKKKNSHKRVKESVKSIILLCADHSSKWVHHFMKSSSPSFHMPWKRSDIFPKAFNYIRYSNEGCFYLKLPSSQALLN